MQNQPITDSSKTKPLDYTTPRIMLYTTINEVDAKALRRAQNKIEERELLAKIFELDKENANTKVSELLLNFYYINLDYVKHKKNYSDEKISTFLAIMDYTFNVCLKNNLTQRECLQIYRGLIKIHSLARPPDSIGLFEKNDIIDLEDFFMKTFYRHFPLYESAIKQKAELSLRTLDTFQVERVVFENPVIDNSIQDSKVEDIPILASLVEILVPPKPNDPQNDENPEGKEETEQKQEQKKEEKKEVKKKDSKKESKKEEKKKK